MKSQTAFSPQNIQITGGVWKQLQDLVRDKVIPYQWKALNDEVPGAEPSHSIENFRIAAGEKSGEFYGLVFQDSDIGKWIEAAGYSLMTRRDAELEAKIDAVVEVIGRAQEPDGYLQTYFTVKAPGKRWIDFTMGHEMYCGGHLLEGAIAYFQATGKDRFLAIMTKYADHLCQTFGRQPGQLIAYDGHPEIELALHKLADVTGSPKYRDLAHFFVDERGKHPDVLDWRKVIAWPPAPSPWGGPDYYQDHLPVREQKTAEGHSVRAMYLYTAMADQYRHTGDEGLRVALDALWNNVVEHRMYVTGGLGSHAQHERFSIDDDLPPDTAYTETCAAIGLVLWAWRMLLIRPDGRYADVLERALYNGALAGLSADGERYFYVNPLEVVPSVARFRRDTDHVKTQRVPWFGCACCPPNIARTIASVAQYQYSSDDNGLWVHQYATGLAQLKVQDNPWEIEQETAYPWDGLVRIRVLKSSGPTRLRLRVPSWCRGASLKVNGKPEPLVVDRGYAILDRSWVAADLIELDLPLEIRYVRSHPRQRESFGKVAVHRGPLVWCAEEVDNGPDLHVLTLGAADRASFHHGKIVVPGTRTTCDQNGAFDSGKFQTTAIDITLVPYSTWGNRGEGEMRVWLSS